MGWTRSAKHLLLMRKRRESRHTSHCAEDMDVDASRALVSGADRLHSAALKVAK